MKKILIFLLLFASPCFGESLGSMSIVKSITAISITVTDGQTQGTQAVNVDMDNSAVVFNGSYTNHAGWPRAQARCSGYLSLDTDTQVSANISGASADSTLFNGYLIEFHDWAVKSRHTSYCSGSAPNKKPKTITSVDTDNAMVFINGQSGYDVNPSNMSNELLVRFKNSTTVECFFGCPGSGNADAKVYFTVIEFKDYAIR